jgi:hypothetical protein
MGGCNTKDSAVSEPKGKSAAPAGAKVAAFKNCDELVDYETFFQSGTTSEVSKCLTKEIWEEYKD